MNKPHILMVEDDAAVGNLIATTLETQNYQFHRAKTGASALVDALSYRPDVMLLDLGLPDMDGVDIIKKVRTWSNLPIIVISARSEDSDKVAALDAGADDYLTKPFSVDELLARAPVALRRVRYDSQKVSEEASLYENGNLKIDYAAGCAYRDGVEIHLTPIEYKLLCLLARNTGKVLTHNFILNEIWGQLRLFGYPLPPRLHGHSAQKAGGGPQPPPVYPDPHRRGLPHDPPEAGGRGLTSAPASLDCPFPASCRGRAVFFFPAGGGSLPELTHS